MLHKLTKTEKTLDQNLKILHELEIRRGYSQDYFSSEWNRQKRIQKEVIGDTNLQQLQNQLSELIDYEEELRESK